MSDEDDEFDRRQTIKLDKPHGEVPQEFLPKRQQTAKLGTPEAERPNMSKTERDTIREMSPPVPPAKALPPHDQVYVAPREAPGVSKHNTMELDKVKLHPDVANPHQAATVVNLKQKLKADELREHARLAEGLSSPTVASTSGKEPAENRESARFWILAVLGLVALAAVTIGLAVHKRNKAAREAAAVQAATTRVVIPPPPQVADVTDPAAAVEAIEVAEPDPVPSASAAPGTAAPVAVPARRPAKPAVSIASPPEPEEKPHF